MDRYRIVTLGLNSITYVKKHLDLGLTLSQMVLENVDLYAGLVMIGLPNSANFGQLEKPDNGGIISIQGKENIDQETKIAKVEKFSTYAIDSIYTHLRSGKNNFCILENANAESSDLNIQKLKSKIVTYKSEVYHFLKGGNITKGEIQIALKEADSLWTYVGFCFKLPQEKNHYTFDNKFSFERLNVLSQHVVSIIVGAYDGETFLVWNKIK